MLNFKQCSGYIETCLSGKSLMMTTQLNKDTAFSQSERKLFKLAGKLPAQIETLEQQTERAYRQFLNYQQDIQKHIYLNNLHDRNQVLFYKLVSEHLSEMVPLIYTPYIAESVKDYSHQFRQARGLFIREEDQDDLDAIFDNRSNPDVDLIVITDSESILGIGDQGVGGIHIPIAKLMLYTLLGGISPLNTLPIYIDVGTNNTNLLSDPFYLGNRHPRISQEKYTIFIDKLVNTIQKKFPLAFLHWEDLGTYNARNILNQYKNSICTFNDDIQGTGVVTLAALLRAIMQSECPLFDHRFMIFGAGTAGTGIADQIYRALLHKGLSEQQACERFWLIDKNGLITHSSPSLTVAQQPYARKEKALCGLSFAEAVDQIKPTVLIGCSSQKGAFQAEIIKKMATFVKKPIIFPLSNPTDHAEATPEDLLRWTEGRALIATGSPFDPVCFNQKTYYIPQCNNALAFPGIGLGVLAVRAKIVTDEMLFIASETLAHFQGDTLLPAIANSYNSTFAIAVAVAQKAIDQGLARIHTDFMKTTSDLEHYIRHLMWKPAYLPLKKPTA